MKCWYSMKLGSEARWQQIKKGNLTEAKQSPPDQTSFCNVPSCSSHLNGYSSLVEGSCTYLSHALVLTYEEIKWAYCTWYIPTSWSHTHKHACSPPLRASVLTQHFIRWLAVNNYAKQQAAFHRRASRAKVWRGNRGGEGSDIYGWGETLGCISILPSMKDPVSVILTYTLPSGSKSICRRTNTQLHFWTHTLK